ncbi:MAG: heparan-alpha-glucosaminide N-acetyltransferase [Candidatus Moraniibacteriota bacterium]
MKNRFWEIDFLRGVAVAMMVLFHFLWDLKFFTDAEIVLVRGFWDWFRIFTAFSFLFLVGISLHLSTYGKGNVFFKLSKRGIYIFSLGLLLSIFSRLFFPEKYIVFGILHLIGTSIILSFFFLRFKYLNLLFGFIFIISGVALNNYVLNIPFLFFLGSFSSRLNTLDYYPLLPWFGVVLWGIFAAKILYFQRDRRFSLPWRGDSLVVRVFSFLGRRSLAVYFFHQPILFLLFYLFTEIVF